MAKQAMGKGKEKIIKFVANAKLVAGTVIKNANGKDLRINATTAIMIIDTFGDRSYFIVAGIQYSTLTAHVVEL